MATFRPEEEDSVYIGHGAEISGAIRARDTIVIDGTVDGEIVCSHLVLGQNGSLKGIVNVSTADIAGHISAEIVAKNLLSVRSTGRVEGKWTCGMLEVARGAILNGAAGVSETAPPQQRRAEPRAETVEVQFIDEPDMEEAPLPIAVTPLRKPTRLASLNLRAPRRSVG